VSNRIHRILPQNAVAGVLHPPAGLRQFSLRVSAELIRIQTCDENSHVPKRLRIKEVVMPNRNDFTAEQWQALRNAPQLVALATAAAGNSGLFGSLSEGMATASAIAEAARGEHALLREIFGKDEIRAAQEQIRDLLKSVPDKSLLNARLQQSATDSVAAALAALSGKGVAADADAYRALLHGVAERVAKASTEGGFLGFGGERVSEGERQFLSQLDSILGTRTA
jgi:hypothetical protein